MSMYLPPQFQSKERGHALALMRAHPFASLISNDDAGFPFVTPVPLHVQECADGTLVLLGHCARPNPHWHYLRSRPEALVTFQGPHAYMSPAVYPDLARVPTWSYLAVHCRVQARLIDGAQDKDALLKALIGDHEPAYAAQWRALGEEFALKMLAGIVAFELRVQDLQCKIKLNQHRKESHAAMHARYGAGTPGERALAGWMQRLGMAGAAETAQEG